MVEVRRGRGERGEWGEIPFVAMGFWRDIFGGQGWRFEVWRGRALLTIREGRWSCTEVSVWLCLAVMLYMSLIELQGDVSLKPVCPYNTQ